MNSYIKTAYVAHVISGHGVVNNTYGYSQLEIVVIGGNAHCECMMVNVVKNILQLLWYCLV
jgi:hypothetical protein